MVQWIQWLNDNWLAVAIPVAILLTFIVGGLWLRKIAYDAFNRRMVKAKWRVSQFLVQTTWRPFLHWFTLLGACIAIQVSVLPLEGKAMANKVIASLFVLSLIWVAVGLGERFFKLYLPEIRLYLAKIKAPQPPTTLTVNIIRVVITIIGVLMLLSIWEAPNLLGILILAAGLFIASLGLRNASAKMARKVHISRRTKAKLMPISKVFLCLLLIVGLAETSRRSYLLFTTPQTDSVSGTVILLLELTCLIWVISVLRSSKYRWRKPSFRLVFFSLLGVALVCAFAGIEPLTSYKDRTISFVGQSWETVTSLSPSFPTQVPEDVASAVAKVEPAVVRIETEDGIGSGMVIDRSGYVLTCNHVVEDVQSATIMLMNGGQYESSVIARDQLRDLAIIQITVSGVKFPVVTLGNSDKLGSGEEVIVIGYSLGLVGKATISKGVVSAFRRSDGVDYIQTDAAINPGNSGGPLVNLKGEVVGIASFKVIHEAVEGMSFGITINSAKPFIINGMEKAHQEEKTQREEQTLIELEKETFRLINVEREERGIPSVVWNEALHNGAREHSENMQEKDYLYHDTHWRYPECCYGASYASSIYATAKATVEAWMSSTAGHREILLDPQYGQGAVGIARDRGFWATYRCY